MIEMHLFDENASREQAHCGADTSVDNRRGVNDYLEYRLDGGNVCEGCKPLAIQFAKKLAWDLEAEGRWDEAEEYRQLVDTLLRETGLAPSSG